MRGPNRRVQRTATPGVQGGFGGKLLYCNDLCVGLGDRLFVCGRVHQAFEAGRRTNFEPDQPTVTEGIVIHILGVVGQRIVNFHHLAFDSSEDLGGRGSIQNGRDSEGCHGVPLC